MTALEFIEDHQWQTYINTRCDACAKRSDVGKDQEEHHAGCETVALIDALKQRLAEER